MLSKHQPIPVGYRLLTIRFAEQHTLEKPTKTFVLRSGEIEAV